MCRSFFTLVIEKIIQRKSFTHTLTCDRFEQFTKAAVKSNRKAMDRNWSNQKANPPLQILEYCNQHITGGSKGNAMKTLADSLQQSNCWKAHIVITLNQDQFRISLLDENKEHDLSMDWAMKFLPM